MRLLFPHLRDALDTIEYAITRDLTTLVTLDAIPEGYMVTTYGPECSACRGRPDAESQIATHQDVVLRPLLEQRVHPHPACYDYDDRPVR